MLGYNMELAWRGLRKFPAVTLLSVLALALGLGATVTARTVTRLLSGDPLPSRTASLYEVSLDSREKIIAGMEDAVPDTLTWEDVGSLHALRPQVRQTAVVNTQSLKIAAGMAGDAKHVDGVEGLQVQSAFFRIFDVPLLEGRGWSAADDASSSPVVVVSSDLARQLFGSASALGQPIRIQDKLFRVVGVSGAWHPYPHFYGLSRCVYSCPAEQVFIPISAARDQAIPLAGFSTCSGDSGSMSVTRPDAASCRYLGFWAELPDAATRSDYRRMLVNYADAQHAAGRFARGGSAAVRLMDIPAYLDSHRLVPMSARFGVWLALSFLLVCMANVTGLLLTRFLRGASELGIRRALGASRQAIFTQCLIEAGLIGFSGALLALPLVWLGLWLVRQQPQAFAGVIGMDWTVVPTLLIFSLLASLTIGMVPAWRASMVEPGLQVKEN